MARQGITAAFANAAAGILYPLLNERNFKIECALGAFAVLLGLGLRISMTEWAIVAVCVAGVLGGECVNTAIEAVVDLASPQTHELAKRAKDCAAGAVLLWSIMSVVVGACLFLPRIAGLFGCGL